MGQTACRSMQISNFCQSSCPTCKLIRSEVSLLSRALHLRTRPRNLLVRSVCTIREVTPSNFLTEYIAALKNITLPLRLLVENEVFRLTVWTNPANDPKRGLDHVCQLEKTMLDVSHLQSILNSCLLMPNRAHGLPRRVRRGRLTLRSPSISPSDSATRPYNPRSRVSSGRARRMSWMCRRRCISLWGRNSISVFNVI